MSKANYMLELQTHMGNHQNVDFKTWFYRSTSAKGRKIREENIYA